MGRYWRTLRRFWGTAVAVQLEYQANVLIELLAVAMSLSGSLFLLSLFYGPDQTLGGWSWAQALMVQGLYTVFDGMATTWLRPNLGAIVTHVREGTLDFVLLKPIDSQFWLSLHTLSPAGLPEIGLGLGLLAWGSHQAGVVLTLAGLFTVLVMLLAGEESIRDTIAFPKTQQARCLMTNAPGGVADQQLEELHVASTWVEPDQEA